MKKFISGLIVGLLLTTTVFASSEQIQAVFTDFNFVINGQDVELEIKPLVYDGASYLPVRELAETLGYHVDFDNKTQTIILQNEIDLDTFVDDNIKKEIVMDTTTININGINYEENGRRKTGYLSLSFFATEYEESARSKISDGILPINDRLPFEIAVYNNEKQQMRIRPDYDLGTYNLNEWTNLIMELNNINEDVKYIEITDKINPLNKYVLEIE